MPMHNILLKIETTQSSLKWLENFKRRWHLFKKRIWELRERLIILENIQISETLCSFNTGFPNYETFQAFFDWLIDWLIGRSIDRWWYWVIKILILLYISDCRRCSWSGNCCLSERTEKISRTKCGDNFLWSKYCYEKTKGNSSSVGLSY